MARTLQKNIRVTPEQWNRIENAAAEHDVSANRLVVALAMEALDRREWPRTELETQLLRSSMFTAQVIARDMAAAGRGDEIAEIARNISKISPELPPDSIGEARSGRTRWRRKPPGSGPAACLTISTNTRRRQDPSWRSSLRTGGRA